MVTLQIIALLQLCVLFWKLGQINRRLDNISAEQQRFNTGIEKTLKA